jgi:hypothetical protein
MTSDSDDLILALDAFVRSVAVKTAVPHAFFLGAGASVSSGVSSAAACTWEWKREIFLTKNPGLEKQFSELLPGVKRKIQHWLDLQGCFPADGSPEEYGTYFKTCYPIKEDRRLYFQEKVRQAAPHTGYKLLCLLAEAGIVRSVWTTNFDGLPGKAAANSRMVPVEIGIDCQHRLLRQPNTTELLCVSMHGDYRYDPLKNTSEELQQQEAQLRQGLIDHIQDIPLIVVGYSGRDASLMEALTSAYSKLGAGSLYWCGYDADDIPESVTRLLDTARKSGRSAYFVPTQGFDDLLVRLSLRCLDDKQRTRVEEIISAARSNGALAKAPFTIPELPTAAVIKSNAFKLEYPGELFQFDIKEWPTEGAWRWFEESTAGRQLVALPFRGKGYALGTIDDIKAAFGENLGGPVERTPTTDGDVRYEDGAIVCLLRRALIRSMAAAANVKTDGEEMLWQPAAHEKRTEQGYACLIHDAVIVYIRRIAGDQYVVLKPTLVVTSASGVELPTDVVKQIKLTILGYQHNDKFNQAMARWRRLLFVVDHPTFEFPPNCGSTFRFRITRAPIMAKIGVRDQKPPLFIKDKYQPAIKHSGMIVPEPSLLFSNKMGTGYLKDSHPVRGITNNRPYDFALTQRHLVSALSLGVICPAAEAKLLHAYLHNLSQRQHPANTERDYLLDYAGFESVFGVPLNIPQTGQAGWVTCTEPSTSLGVAAGALELAASITRAVTALEASAAPNVVLIFIPDRWKQWRKFETDDEKFDLHDFIKAACIPRGVATQFLEQDTFSNPYQCRVLWWLSLALYVKTMRTPWVLDSLDSDTAFVGLGFSYDSSADKGRQIVLGCSHIYNARGEGLQFRLTKIENYVIRNRNPFMSKDDARRVGEMIRQLFWESKQRLPKRVVIHKNTPFSKDEREGLIDGLDDVPSIDLIEIQIDSALRYVSSTAKAGGEFAEDRFPVRRGTVIKLDGETALLWVHGVATALNPKMKYYQGKRRIPAPLVVRRHVGQSDLNVLAEEILGLSKMNWNTFDLYTKLPATIQSSSQIARIGSLLQRFSSVSYDYRLFM